LSVAKVFWIKARLILGRLWRIWLIILCGGFAVLQVSVFDGLSFDLLPFDQDGLPAPEVDAGQCCYVGSWREARAQPAAFEGT